MELGNPGGEACAAGLGVADEVVVVGEDRPRLQLPAGLLGPGVLPALQIVGAVAHALLDAFVKRFEAGLPFGNLAHIAKAWLDGNHQKGVFKNHPAGVFEPAPGTWRQYTEDGLWQEESTQ